MLILFNLVGLFCFIPIFSKAKLTSELEEMRLFYSFCLLES